MLDNTGKIIVGGFKSYRVIGNANIFYSLLQGGVTRVGMGDGFSITVSCDPFS